MKRKPAIIAFMVALCLAFAVSLFWKPPLDLSQDEEPFNRMAMPPKSVIAGMIMDGGSIVVRVTDQTETHIDITFPIDRDKIRNPYPTAYYSPPNDWNNKRLPLKNPDRAKQIAIRLLHDYGTNTPNPEPADDYDYTARATRSLTNPSYIKAVRLADQMKNRVKNLFP